MAKHARKTQAEIEEEIRRQAQGAARAKGETIVVARPSIAITTEPTHSGSHWILAETGEQGRPYVEAAAVRLARLWDVERH
jgi:hypothetical protein